MILDKPVEKAELFDVKRGDMPLMCRRVMPKGSSFDGLRQEQVDRMISHVNSYPRQSLGGRTPYDEFVSFYGERDRVFLEKPNVRRINADCVTLDPSLLGPEFKHEADNAMWPDQEIANENPETESSPGSLPQR